LGLVDIRLAVGTNGRYYQLTLLNYRFEVGLCIGEWNVTTDTLSLNNQIGVWTSGVNIDDVNFLWDALTQTQTIAGAKSFYINGGITNRPASCSKLSYNIC
jgi:hypothetical protein